MYMLSYNITCKCLLKKWTIAIYKDQNVSYDSSASFWVTTRSYSKDQSVKVIITVGQVQCDDDDDDDIVFMSLIICFFSS